MNPYFLLVAFVAFLSACSEERVGVSPTFKAILPVEGTITYEG